MTGLYRPPPLVEILDAGEDVIAVWLTPKSLEMLAEDVFSGDHAFTVAGWCRRWAEEDLSDDDDEVDQQTVTRELWTAEAIEAGLAGRLEPLLERLLPASIIGPILAAPREPRYRLNVDSRPGFRCDTCREICTGAALTVEGDAGWAADVIPVFCTACVNAAAAAMQTRARP